MTKRATVARVGSLQPQTAASLKLWLDEIRVEVRLGVLGACRGAPLVMWGAGE